MEKEFRCLKCRRSEKEVPIGACGYCDECVIEVDNRNIKEAIKLAKKNKEGWIIKNAT